MSGAAGLLPESPPPGGWGRTLAVGLAVYLTSGAIAITAVVFSQEFIRPRSAAGASNPSDVVRGFTTWDGRKYQAIVNKGYEYHPTKASSVAFFPAYPLSGWLLARGTGLRTDAALVIAAHAALVAAFVVWTAYLRVRQGGEGTSAGALALLAFALWPTTFFFRMAYSESIFLLFAIVVFYGLQRNWPLWVLAILVGAATATRPVGVALVPVLALEIWRRSAAIGTFAIHSAWAIPVACWGLLAFMTYQAAQFDDPLAFAQTQENWRLRRPAPLLERADSLAVLEPMWTVFDESSPCYWAKDSRNPSALFNLRLANPIYFAIALVLFGLGAWKGWLNANEILLSAGLIAIPYVTRSYEMCFCSMGRFCAVAFPLYIVMGHLLARLPLPVAMSILAISAFFMGAYAALFAAGYPLF